MRPEKQEARKQQIEAAAYELLAEKGYRATSMLAVAKRASASNETLYKWYGNKEVLFRSLVEANAREVTLLLQQCVGGEAPIRAILERLGPLLLSMVTSDKAIVLNRAAAANADETGILGQTLSQAGKDSVAPLIAKVFEQARDRGELSFDETGEAVELYLNLLIGDLQIRRVIGACPVLSKRTVQHRAERAWRVLHTVCG